MAAVEMRGIFWVLQCVVIEFPDILGGKVLAELGARILWLRYQPG